MDKNNKRRRIPLQAISDGTKQLNFTADVLTRIEIDWLQDIIQQGLNLDCSLSVIVRAGVQCLANEYREEIIKLSSGMDNEDIDKRLLSFLEKERDRLWTASGREIP